MGAALLATGCQAVAATPAERAISSSPKLLFREAMAEGTPSRWLPGDGVVVRDSVGREDESFGIEAEAGGTVRALPLSTPGFERADRATIHVRVDAASTQSPLELELSFFDDSSGNRWWRTLTLDRAGWHAVDVPLSELRYDRGLTPKWENVGSWGVTFRTDGVVEFGDFELWQDGDRPTPYRTTDELRADFPDPASVREGVAGPFVVLTDERDLDMDAVLDALMRMHAQTYANFPSMPPPKRAIPLLVFASDEDYRAFWDRFGDRVGGRVRPKAQDQGYTWQGIAATTYSDEYGPVRPVYVHEASHALLEQALGLAAQGSWLYEGIGILAQLEVSKQDLSGVYRRGLARSDVKTPIFELVAGRPIATSRYWQAVLLVEWMLADPGRRAALDAALVDMRSQGSTDLRPLLERHFGLDMPRLSASFWAWAWSTYAKAPGT